MRCIHSVGVAVGKDSKIAAAVAAGEDFAAADGRGFVVAVGVGVAVADRRFVVAVGVVVADRRFVAVVAAVVDKDSSVVGIAGGTGLGFEVALREVEIGRGSAVGRTMNL